MQAPDFARLDQPLIGREDLVFLFERFPQQGLDPVAAAQHIHEVPSTLESLLESDWVHDALLDPDVPWVQVTPRLFFNVVLRRSLRGRRRMPERRALNYLAHVLSLFLHTERLYRVQPHEDETFEYLADLVQEAQYSGPERRFLVHSHIGNYALYLSGLCAPWIEHRYRFRRRPLSLDYYRAMGRSFYASAAQHHLADEWDLRNVFSELARRFDYYRRGLEQVGATYLTH